MPDWIRKHTEESSLKAKSAIKKYHLIPNEPNEPTRHMQRLVARKLRDMQMHVASGQTIRALWCSIVLRQQASILQNQAEAHTSTTWGASGPGDHSPGPDTNNLLP